MSSHEFEAPLAQNEDWADFTDFQASSAFDSNENIQGVVDERATTARMQDIVNCNEPNTRRNESNTRSDNAIIGYPNHRQTVTTDIIANETSQVIRNDNDFDDCNFCESISGSLEDLVHSFDEKIIHCFQDYDEQLDTFAPVQVLSPEELLSDNE